MARGQVGSAVPKRTPEGPLSVSPFRFSGKRPGDGLESRCSMGPARVKDARGGLGRGRSLLAAAPGEPRGAKRMLSTCTCSAPWGSSGWPSEKPEGKGQGVGQLALSCPLPPPGYASGPLCGAH